MEFESAYAVFGPERKSREGYTITKDDSGNYWVTRPDGFRYAYHCRKFKTAVEFAEMKCKQWKRGENSEGIYKGIKRMV